MAVRPRILTADLRDPRAILDPPETREVAAFRERGGTPVSSTASPCAGCTAGVARLS